MELDIRYAQDGTVYTYVTDKGSRRTFQWRFILGREKGIEMFEFVKAYHSSEITITDHRNRRIVGNFVVNPMEFRTPGKGILSITQGVRNERMEVTFEFEGTVQS